MATFSDYIIQRKPPSPDRRDNLNPPPPHDPNGGEISGFRTPAGKSPKLAKKFRSAEGEESGRVAALEDTAAKVTISERKTATALLTEIGQKFAENRQKSKSKAFEIYQRDLATNSGALVMGGAVTLKELTVLLMDLEAFVKSSQKEGETPATLLGQFLRGELDLED